MCPGDDTKECTGRWVDYDSDSNYDAFELIENIRKRIRRRHQMSAAPKHIPTTRQTVVRWLGFLMQVDPLPFMEDLWVYAEAAHNDILQLRCKYPNDALSEDEIQLVVDGLARFFPRGVVLQTVTCVDPDGLEEVHYRPFRQPGRVGYIGKRVPLIFFHRHRIVRVAWLVTMPCTERHGRRAWNTRRIVQ